MAVGQHSWTTTPRPRVIDPAMRAVTRGWRRDLHGHAWTARAQPADVSVEWSTARMHRRLPDDYGLATAGVDYVVG